MLLIRNTCPQVRYVHAVHLNGRGLPITVSESGGYRFSVTHGSAVKAGEFWKIQVRGVTCRKLTDMDAERRSTTLTTVKDMQIAKTISQSPANISFLADLVSVNPF